MKKSHHRGYWLVVLMLVSSVFAQSRVKAQLDLSWAKKIGGINSEIAESITVDKNGNVYGIGRFAGTADFDPGPATFNLISAGAEDAFIFKLDSNGDFKWAKRFGGTQNESGLGIVIDTSGNVFTTGYFEGTADFDPGPGVFNLITSPTNANSFVSKLDSNGNFVWAKQFTGASSCRGFSIACDQLQHLYITGDFMGTIDFDPGAGMNNITCPAATDAFVVKLDDNGLFIWARSFTGTVGYEWPNSIKVDSLSNVYVAGLYQGIVDFDPGAGVYNLSAAGGYDIFVSKLNSAGNYVWAKGIGGNSSDYCYSLAIDLQQNVYITGNLFDTADFNPGPLVYTLTNSGVSGSADIYVCKLNSTGDFKWAKTFTGNGSDDGYSVAVNNAGEVLTTGLFKLTVDFDPGPAIHNLTSQFPADPFISKLDSSGNYVFAKYFSGTGGGADVGKSIVTDALGNVYVIGTFSGTTDFDPGPGVFSLTATSNPDVFITKLSPCIATNHTIQVSACDAYTAPDGQIYNATGIYFATLFNSSGCDSNITIDLKIQNNDTLLTVLACGTYVAPDSQIYSTSGIYTAVINNVAGCDSSITINLSIVSVNTTVQQTGVTLTANLGLATYQWLDCENGFAPLPGETGQSFTASVNGTYAVIITKNGCSDTSSCHFIDGVGLSDLNDTFQCKIFPNPARDYVEILWNKNAQVVIIAPDGRLVYNSILSSSVNKVDLSAFSNGVYLVKLNFAGFIVTDKLIIVR